MRTTGKAAGDNALACVRESRLLRHSDRDNEMGTVIND